MRYLIGHCLVAACLVTALFVAGPVAAQQDSRGLAVALHGPQSISLSLNKGELFALPVDARDVLVANTDIADVIIKTPRLAYVFAQAVGDTNVFFLDADGNQILRLEIHVEPDLSALREIFENIMPGEAINVTASNQHIILSGSVSSAQASDDARLIALRFVTADANLVNMLKITNTQQVLLKVRVAEMQRTVVKELGFNAFLALGQPFSFLTGGGLNADAFSGIPGTDIEGFAGTARNLGASIDFYSTTFNTFRLLFDALEREGVVKTLAEPNLTAVSGENANFLAGGEFPILVPSGDNVAIEFRQFGVILTFTPVVLSSNRINLKISSEVSQLSDIGAVTLAGFNIPSLAINRAETTVEVPSGGSLLIAGLLQNDIANTIDGFPGLKDIPILGTLFRSTAFQKSESELVVAVSAFLIKPVDEKSIVLPTDGFAPASDFDMYFLGRLHDVYKKPESTSKANLAGGLLGPVGYIME